MIASFKCKHTQMLWESGRSKRFPSVILRAALRKLWMLDSADDVNDLRVPPSNHLERLYGDRLDYYSIRINIQWRLCFTWRDDSAYDVEIIDYH